MDRPNPFATLFQEIADIAQATLRQSPDPGFTRFPASFPAAFLRSADK